MIKFVLIGATALAIIAVPALAQDRGRMTVPATRAEVEAKVKERFAMMDSNRDGFVAKAEVDALKAAKRKERQDRHFAHMDANKDGTITRAEFDAGHGTRSEGRAETREGRWGGKRLGMMGKRGDAMVDRQDADKDGRVSLAEALAKPLARFDRADANKDGTLTPEERKAARQQMREEWRANRG